MAEATLPPNPRIRNLIGMKFGMLSVVSFDCRVVVGNSFKYRWRTLCDCGRDHLVVSGDLVTGNTISCGCFHRKLVGDLFRTHGFCKYPEYTVWKSMIDRCTRETCKHFHRYGGRGISVCDRWLSSFEDFLSDMGRRPTNRHTIERVNNDLGYNPENCVWATYYIQSRNTSQTRFIDFNGKKQCLADWAAELGIDRRTLRSRLESKWSIERAMTTPVRRRTHVSDQP